MGVKADMVHTLFDKGKRKMALIMIEIGVDGVNVRDRDKCTLLHKALGDISTMRRLIAAGADPNAQVRSTRL